MSSKKSHKNGNGISVEAENLLKLLRKGDQSFKVASIILKISSDKVADLAEQLTNGGYAVNTYIDAGENYLTLSRAEDVGLEVLPISLTNRKIKIAFISELRIGAFQSQVSLTHWIYKEIFEREAVDFAVVAGGLTIGAPTITLQPDIFKSEKKRPMVLADYVIKSFPKSDNFKTYIISNRRELALKTKEGVNLLNLIARNRDDLAVAGDLEKTFDVRGVRIKVMSAWDDNSPKGLSYGLQKIVDGISDSPAPHIIVAGGIHERCELPDYGEHGIYVFGVPSLHSQMRRQFRKGVLPRIGCLILELEFNKDWTIDLGKSLRADFRNLDDYVVSNDCFATVEDLNIQKLSKTSRTLLEWFVKERVVSEGELSRRLNKSKQFVRKAIAILERRAKLKIPFSTASKRYEFPQIEKKQFKPLPIKHEDVFRFVTKEGGLACTHYGSKHDLTSVIRQAYQDAADLGVRRVNHAGDVTDGPGASGYRGHQNDVKFSDMDNMEDYAVAEWPRVKIKVDPKHPMIQTRMVLNKEGQPTYEEYVLEKGEVWLQTDIIDGNHDCWAKQEIGHRPARTLALRMPDLLRYLGPKDGSISMDGSVIFEGIFNRLTHGDGGLGYTISPKLQKHLASHRRRDIHRDKPTVLWFGNWHTNFILFQDELAIMLACFKSEDEFHLRRDLVSWVGMNIVELYVDNKNHLTRVVSDYRNYRNLALMNS